LAYSLSSKSDFLEYFDVFMLKYVFNQTELELSRGKKLGIYGKETEQAVAEAAAQNPLPPTSLKKSPVRIMPNTSLSSTIPHSTLQGSVSVDSTL
jgi:hypothetical protein